VKYRFEGLVSNTDVANELAQEVFTRLFEAMGNGRRIDELRGFINGLMQNVFHEHLRQKRRQPLSLLDNYEFTDNNSLSPEGASELADTREALWEILARFTPEEQWIILGRNYFGMTGQQMADSINIPRRTFVDRHNRVMQRLRSLALRRGLTLKKKE
jgi:RNA polymerase sigma factor (sigma-70 family)